MADATAGLPPGDLGLPVIGETFSFLGNGFAFIDARVARHGRVFKSRLLGRNVVVLAGPDGAGQFIDADDCMRQGSMPPHIQALFGGESLPLLDGQEHTARKTLVLQGFSHAALASYVPALQAVVERYLARWAESPQVAGVAEAKALALDAICSNALGMQPGPALDELRVLYEQVTSAFSSLPLPLPGTAYTRALAARDRILAIWERAIAEHRAKPTEDVLSRILAARTADGVAITDAQAKLELHHVVLAGFIVWAELAGLMLELGRRPELLATVRAEVMRACPSGPVTPGALRDMPQLGRVVMETKRLAPVLPAIFAKAKRDFVFSGARVPAGWMVMWALSASNRDATVYTRPNEFDPERFAPGRAEHEKHEHAYVPQGAGPAIGHRCPGLDFATLIMSVFATLLVRGYDWTLPTQDLAYDYSKLPPEPKDGLRVVVKARVG